MSKIMDLVIVWCYSFCFRSPRSWCLWGLAAIVAEVFGDICSTSFALYIPVWISIGFGAVAVFVLVNLLIIFLRGFFCRFHLILLTNSSDKGADSIEEGITDASSIGS
jgi:hypothetical protein